MFTFGRTLQLSKSKMFYSHKMRNQKRYFATKVTHREVKQNVTTTWVIYIICQEFYYTYILYMILLHKGCHGRDRMVVLVYNYMSNHLQRCEFESRSWREYSIQQLCDEVC